MKDKRYRRIKSLICKYHYLPKLELPASQLREYKLNKLFGKKVKPLPIFPGVDPKSTEHRERMEVFRYFYAQKKDDEFIKNHWWSLNNQKIIQFKHKKISKITTFILALTENNREKLPMICSLNYKITMKII